MAAHLPQLPRVILYEGKDSQPFAAEVRQELMVKLLDKGYTVSRATEKGRLENLGHEKVIVVGIFDLAMQPVSSDSIHVQDVRGQSSESIFETVESIAKPTGQDSAAAPKRWKPC